MDPERRATIDDVAREAGVSVATVSRALRGLPNVAPATRQRVQRAAEHLSYEPDSNASRLAGGSTKVIALIVPAFDSWYFSQVLASAEAVLYEHGYDVLVAAVTSEQRRCEFVQQAARQRRFDGVIIVDLAPTDDEISLLVAAGCASVAISYRGSQLPSVYLDEVDLAREAVAYLADLGHERIGLIGGQHVDPFNFVVASDRQVGYEAELAARGLPVESSLMTNGNFSVAGGSDAMAELLDQPDPPTAVFAMSDEMAIGAMACLRGVGLDVPGDISIIGVDDHPMAAIMGLTTIRQEIEVHGSVAATLLVASLEDRSQQPESVQLETDLIVRRSTRERNRAAAATALES